MVEPDVLKPRLQAALGGAYLVERELGAGGFAHVFLVADRKLGRKIAVKVLRPEFTGSRSSVQRFIREAESAAKLHHPHILQIFFVGEGEGLVYFGMPYVEGETLDALLRREGQLPEEEVARIGAEIAEALAEAHSHALVHRDVKPQNVLLQAPKRRVLVADFGIAKAAAGTGERLTGTGVIIGSPHYMSPEQAAGEPTVDHRSDIYSLGIVLWEMLAGEVPFDGPSSQGILIKHLTQPMPAVKTKRPNVSAGLSKVVARCTEKKREDRYQSAAEVAEALKAAGAGVPAYGRAETAGALGARRRRLAWVGAASAGVAVLTLGVYALGRSGGAGEGGGLEHGAAVAGTSVAVLPFEALVSGGDPAQFGRSAAQLLADALGQRHQVPTVDGRELLGHWSLEQLRADAPLDAKLAFAAEHGGNQAVLGSAVEAGDQLRLSVDVYHSGRRWRVARAEETGHRDSLFALVDRLAGAIATGLCAEPDYNPGNLCFDTPPRLLDTLAIPSPGARGQATPPSFYVRVSKAGGVTEVRVRTPSSADTVTALARSVVEGARYQPATKGRREVEAWLVTEVGVRGSE
jgi:serine/threonine-protein kinase